MLLFHGFSFKGFSSSDTLLGLPSNILVADEGTGGREQRDA